MTTKIMPNGTGVVTGITLDRGTLGKMPDFEVELFRACVARNFRHVDVRVGMNITKQQSVECTCAGECDHVNDISKAVDNLFNNGGWHYHTCQVHTSVLDAINARAVCDCTRTLAKEGLDLSHAEADQVGQEALGWVTTRLGCSVSEDAKGTIIHPASVS